MTLSKDVGLAVVTGASSGIGAVYADRLAARGHDLLLIARRADRLESVAARLRDQYGVGVAIEVADLAAAEDLARVADRLRASDLSFLVNNAGVGGLGATSAVSAERLESVIHINVTALTRLSHAALEVFRARGSGTLVNIGSIIALTPSGGAPAYSGSKAYVLNFTRSLQVEYADSAIRIQLVQPGPIRTEFFAAAGTTEDIFPADTFLSAEQLVDAAFAGLAAGEAVTTPSLLETEIWDALESRRIAFMEAVRSGQVARRYGIVVKEDA
ncbi:SDR family oxidoreductase [Sphingobium sp. 22B]|uniref:SDR family NAD(P)-dependent oxidoreductase n=1 Tax=unclassified Sphingobium TaxID=2611147 RepID=UPI0007814566|nr:MULTISPECIES: SDR family NAD(P)-dependent oxidoreductase [unclassified Sphingobium]KXU32680.1 SDR family oxidoreductase [Sphingobium sp. AM]KYC32757.1 SDR family oxidoreductase [Sphingobium sp. 22B]OAP31646.1 SDR family oxidoreductase [Sphingobium sp. 20006FA]